MQKARILAFAAAAALALSACVGGSKGLSSEDKDKLKAYILDKEPADIPHKLDINFENKLHIVGYKVEPELAKPGTEIKLTYYWRCDDTLDDGWALFTHVTDESQAKSDNLDWTGPLRDNRDGKQVLGPSRWERGKYYVDEQSYKVPDWVKGPELTFYVGVWKQSARLHVVSGPNDGDNRAIVAKVKTGLQPPPEQHTELLPDYTATKLAKNDKITIDGKADEAAWKGAAVLGPFVDVGTGAPNTVFPANGKARLLFDDQNLYAFVEVTEQDVVGGWDVKAKKVPAAGAKDDSSWTTSGQPKLWTKDAVEIMTDPGPAGDNKTYYELQISPQNLVFHSQFDEYNTPKTEPNGPFGHEDWDPKIKSAVVVHGTLDNDKDKDTGYDVELAIPWSAFSKNPAAKNPPQLGDVWRMNFYAMKKNSGVAWSPIEGKGNFHFAPRFGRVHWGMAALPPGIAPVRGPDGGVIVAPGGPIDPATGMAAGRGLRIPRMRPPGSMAPANPPP